MKMYRLKNAVPLILATFVIFLIVSCSIVYHGVKGRVVEILNSAVYLDIRTGDGVSFGQELNVYTAIIYNEEHRAIPASKGAQTGKVKIINILNDHLAKAAVISGKAEKGDIAELVHPK